MKGKWVGSEKIETVMTKEVITIEPRKPVAAAVKKMVECDIECLPVTQSGVLKGLITFRDIVVKIVYRARDPTKTEVREVMVTDVITCSPDTTVLDVAKLMKSKRLRRIPVVSGGKLVGIVTNFDLAVAGWDLGP